MTSIDHTPSVSAPVSSEGRPYTSQSQPTIEAVNAFENLVAAEESVGSRADNAAPVSGGNETESRVTVDDIRDNIRDQIIKDLITKHTNFQL